MKKRVACFVFGGIFVLSLLPISAQRRAAELRGRTETVRITFRGMKRQYLLHVPGGASGALVLAFHGGSESPEHLEEVSGLSTLADRERFIVAYPEGIDKSWADGRGATAADKKGIDDVGFAKAIVADISKSYAVERARVYATGPSNGGIFVNRLGCDAADTFAAIAPVIGTIAAKLAPNCKPSMPIAVLGVQSVADPAMPFQGGEVGGSLRTAAGGQVLGSRATQDLWRSLQGCNATPESTMLPVRVNDHTSVTRRLYSGCRPGGDVIWYEIEGGGHRWPPHRGRVIQEAVAKKELGLSSQNIDASEVIWAFFSSHHR